MSPIGTCAGSQPIEFAVGVGAIADSDVRAALAVSVAIDPTATSDHLHERLKICRIVPIHPDSSAQTLYPAV